MTYYETLIKSLQQKNLLQKQTIKAYEDELLELTKKIAILESEISKWKSENK